LKSKFAAKKNPAATTDKSVTHVIKPLTVRPLTEPTVVKTAVKTTVTTTLPPMSFDQFDFSPEMMKAITEMGYTSPSPIQQEAIPMLLGQHTDFLGLAATGTGKTAAFGIPLLENLKAGAKGVQALILCPTRELAKQVAEQMNLLAKFKKTKSIAIYGGADYGGEHLCL